jgi:hypothetical protein
MKSHEFRAIIKSKCAEFKRRISAGLIQNAKEADEVAAEIASESKFTTKQFETLLAILFVEAGKFFPGNWEDYSRAK